MGISNRIQSGGSHFAVARVPRSQCRRTLQIEPLEGRSLLSAAPMPLVADASFAAEAVVTPQIAPGEENFVVALYRDLLGRAPDPAGLDSYVNMLNSGSPPAAVVDSIWESAEHRGVQIDGFYQTFLNRAADPDGRQFWIDSLINGMSEDEVRSSFVTSAEFQQLHPVPGQYAESLYNTLLNRAPDQDGLAFWITQLQISIDMVPEVADAFIDSPERHQILVTSFYSQFLMRAPDPAGFTHYTAQLDQGLTDERSIAEEFLSSTEYVNLHPLP